MIAPPTATSEMMLRALSYTLAALEAAAELDVDRNPEDRAFFNEAKNELLTNFEELDVADTAYSRFLIRESVRLQARVIVGDTVLDRGVRSAKALVKVQTKLTNPTTADEVFGGDVTALVDAPMRSEPMLVLQAVDRLEQAVDFSDKAQLKTDLTGRAQRQNAMLSERDNGEMSRARLQTALAHKIADSAEALYRLEKRLLDRFPYDRIYVRQFFYDATPTRRTAKTTPPQA